MPLRRAPLAMIVIVSCADAPSLPRTTPSPAASASARPTASAAAPPAPPFALDDVLAKSKEAVARRPSLHGAGDLDAVVFANEAAASYPTPRATLPEGAAIVERLFARGGNDPIGYYAMVRRASGFATANADWEFLVLGPSGAVEQRGNLPHCARCHADAPHDFLFGPLR